MKTNLNLYAKFIVLTSKLKQLWIDAKYLPSSTLLLLVLLFNVFLYSSAYYLFIANSLTDIENLKSIPNSNPVLENTNFMPKISELKKLLNSNSFKKIYDSTPNVALFNLKTNLEKFNFSDFNFQTKQNLNGFYIVEISGISTWSKLQDFMQTYLSKNSRFFVENFYLKNLEFKNTSNLLEFYFSLNDTLSLLNDDPIISIDENDFSDIEYSNIKYKNLIEKIFALNPNLFLETPLVLQDPFKSSNTANNLINNKTKNSKTKNITASFTEQNMTFSLIGILASNSKTVATIQINSNSYQTLKIGEFVQNTKIKLFKINPEHNSILLYDTNSKKYIKLTL